MEIQEDIKLRKLELVAAAANLVEAVMHDQLDTAQLETDIVCRVLHEIRGFQKDIEVNVSESDRLMAETDKLTGIHGWERAQSRTTA